MTKISYEDYLRLIGDPETTRERLLDLVIVARGEGGLDFEIRPDPEKVDLSPARTRRFWSARATAGSSSRC